MTVPAPKDPVDRWLAEVVPGRTFVDVGGIGVRSINERVTFAVRAGATRAAMADIRPFSYYEWDVFNEKCAAAGITDIDRYENVDITSPQLPLRLPCFDVVHCTGVFYHVPSPVTALDMLRQIVGKHLIINTITVPQRVETALGTLEFNGNVALFAPGLSQREREILRAHYDSKFTDWTLDDVAPTLEAQAGAKMPFREGERLSCWPWWWVMSDDCFRSLIRLMGFVIRAEWKWEDHALFCACEKL